MHVNRRGNSLLFWVSSLLALSLTACTGMIGLSNAGGGPAEPPAPTSVSAFSSVDAGVDSAGVGVPGGIPHRATICASFSPGATAEQINLAISRCSNGVVELKAGVYSAASLGGHHRSLSGQCHPAR